MSGRTFSLHLVTDRARTFQITDDQGPTALVKAVEQALSAGVDWVQVREKSAPALDLLHTVEAIQTLAAGFDRGVIVNDRIDVALAARADGVHLGKKSLPPLRARQVMGFGPLIGASVHGLDEAIAAANAGVDYITFGHVFPTASKPGLSPRGLAALREIVKAVDVPVLAIGGITAEQLPSVLATGCAGIAVIGAILASPDPAKATRRLRRTMDRFRGSPRHRFPEPVPAVRGGRSRCGCA